MKIETLRSFQAVLDTGSFVAASHVLGLTPSAISLQMKQLEEYFGQVLFDRSARIVKPTPFGLAAAEPVAQSLNQLEALRTKRTVSASGTLRLGIIANVEKSVLPRALRMLQVRNPTLDIKLSLDVSTALIEAVKAGRIDAAIVVRPKSGGGSRLHWTNLVRETFVLLAADGIAPARPQLMLQRHPWIRYDIGLTGGRIAADYVRRLAPDKHCAFEITSTDAIVSMVAQELGISVVPKPREQLLRAYRVQAIELGKDAPWRQIALLTRRNEAEDRRIKVTEEALRAAYAGPPVGYI